MKWIVLFALAGCGGASMDPRPDAAPSSDAYVGPVTITIADQQPAEGWVVYFQNGDSSLVAKTTTDANGVATAVMAAGGYVTVVPSPMFQVYTFAGVMPGDTLRLAASPQTTSGADAVVIAPASMDTTVTAYELRSSCFGAGIASDTPSFSVPVAGCGDTMDLLIAARDATSIREWLFAANVPLSSTPIDLSTETYAAPATRAVTFSNAPGTVLGLTSVVEARGSPLLSQYAMTASAQFSTPALQNLTYLVAITLAVEPDRHRIQHRGPWSPTVNVDVSGRLLTGLATCPALDPVPREITWTETAAGLAPDIAVIAVGWQTGPDWLLVAPYEGTTVTFPQPPAELASLDIAAGAGARIVHFDRSKFPGGYSAVRAGAPWRIGSVVPYVDGDTITQFVGAACTR